MNFLYLSRNLRLRGVSAADSRLDLVGDLCLATGSACVASLRISLGCGSTGAVIHYTAARLIAAVRRATTGA